MSIRMLVQRITRVEYPEKAFQLGGSTVNATITSPDLSGAELTATEHEIERGMREQADQQFRDIIAKAIKAFDDAETAWNGVNACASIEFTPARANTKTLHRGDTGGFDARTERPARRLAGDRATWTLVGAGNAEISPRSASSNPATLLHCGSTRRRPSDLRSRPSYKVGLEGGRRAGDVGAADRGRAARQPHRRQLQRDAELARLDLQLERERHLRPRPPGAGGSNGYFTLQSGQYTVVASGRDGAGARPPAGSPARRR